MIINGEGVPKILVLDATHPRSNPLVSVTLPYCEKLTETFTPVQTLHYVQSGVLADKKGYTYKATLSYEEHLDGQVLASLQEMFNVGDEGEGRKRQIVLIPRVDALENNYNVFLAESINVGIIPNNVGHRDVVFIFQGTDIEPTVPTVTEGYGTHYGSYNGDGVTLSEDGYGDEL